jgi:metal-responsive CopG/Arc/MetJ family transcriptional regulator
MPSKKPLITLVVDEKLLERIEDFRFDNRIANRSEAIRILVEAGLKSKPKTPKKKK